MKLVRYFANWYHCPYGVSSVQYAAGAYYPETDETLLHVAQGHAELVNVSATPEKAAELAEKAAQAAAVYVDRADTAAMNAEAAAAAAEIATAAAADPAPADPAPAADAATGA